MRNFTKHFMVRASVAVGAFFIIFLVIGLSIFKDYGVHWDEYNNQSFGRRWTNYIVNIAKTGSFSVAQPKPHGEHDFLHGPVFEIFMTLLADHLHLKDSRDIIMMRHLAIFLLFYVGMVFFYLLCLRYFQSWRLALLGCVFLALSPRIFADAFYNSVDIAFLSLFIIAMFTLVAMLDKRTPLSAVIHAFTCAILINIRPLGLFLLIVTVFFFCLEILRAHLIKEKISGLGVFAGYFIFLCIFAVSLNPLFWTHPWYNFIFLINKVKYLNDHGGVYYDYRGVYYLGADFSFAKLPWHYAPVWIMVSTPLIYSALFFTGIFASIKLFFKSGAGSYLIKRNTVILLVCFFIPLIMSKGRLYGGWRHIYFIYPLFIILAVKGFKYLWQNIGQAFRCVLIAGLLFGLLDTAFFMARNHPYQNIYFNRLAGKNAGEIVSRFELDYWGLSYRRALEYILKTDKDDILQVCSSARLPMENNKMILLPDERKRLVYVPVEKARYLLTDNTAYRLKYPCKEYYMIKVEGIRIMSVYKLDH